MYPEIGRRTQPRPETLSQDELLRRAVGWDDAGAPKLSFPRKRESRDRQMKQPAVYMLASQRNGTLYTGITSDLVRRIWEHRNDLVEGFTKRYRVHTLVYFELHDDISYAIRREKQIKKWNRAWKIELIEQTNPQWKDLWPPLIESETMDLPIIWKAPYGIVNAGLNPIVDSLNAGVQSLDSNLDSRFRGND